MWNIFLEQFGVKLSWVEINVGFIPKIGLIFKCKFKVILSFLGNIPTPDQVNIPCRVESHTQLPLQLVD